MVNALLSLNSVDFIPTGHNLSDLYKCMKGLAWPARSFPTGGGLGNELLPVSVDLKLLQNKLKVMMSNKPIENIFIDHKANVRLTKNIIKIRYMKYRQSNYDTFFV